MDLRELGYFIAVYEEKSVTAAAKRCFISQPSVSAALASLEEELATKLFVRHRKGATPTPGAEQLYPMARRLVDEAKAVRASFRAKTKVAELTIGLMAALDVGRVRDVLAIVTERRDTRVRVVSASERCDVRMIDKTTVAKGETFAPLWSERFVVALPSTHPLALRDTVRASDLLGERFVERCHCEHARHVRRGKKGAEPVAIAASEEWALALVSAGVGIALVPAGSVRPDPRVVVKPIADVAVVREVGLAYERRGPRARAVHDVVERVRHAFA